MIEKLVIQKLPNVDAIPEDGQHRIEWIVNGECLNGALSKTGNEGTLNRAPLAIQRNVEKVNENAQATTEKVNEVVEAVNNINDTLGAIADGSIIDVVNQTVARVDKVETDLSDTKTALEKNISDVDGLDTKIGVRPATDDSNRSIYNDIAFIKQEMGSYPEFNINGVPDATNTGSGLKYRVIQNTMALNNHSQRINTLEENWRDSDVGALTDEVNQLRQELGDTSLATHDNIYLRLRTNTRNIANLSNEIIEVKKSIMFDSVPSIGEKLTTLTARFNTLNDDVNSVESGIRPRLSAIEKKIGDHQTMGTIIYRLSNAERELTEAKDILGQSSTDGLRGVVTKLAAQLGTDKDKNSIAGRLKTVENAQGRFETSIHDIENQIGDASSGLTAGVIKLSSDMYGKMDENDPFLQKGVIRIVKELQTTVSSQVADVPDDGLHYLRKNGEWVQVAHACGAFKNTAMIEIPLSEQNTYEILPLTNVAEEIPLRQMTKGENRVIIHDKGTFRIAFRASVKSTHNAAFAFAIFKNGVNVFEATNGHYGTDELMSYSTFTYLNIDKEDKITIKIKGVSEEAVATPAQIQEFLLGISPV